MFIEKNKFSLIHNLEINIEKVKCNFSYFHKCVLKLVRVYSMLGLKMKSC